MELEILCWLPTDRYSWTEADFEVVVMVSIEYQFTVVKAEFHIVVEVGT